MKIKIPAIIAAIYLLSGFVSANASCIPNNISVSSRSGSQSSICTWETGDEKIQMQININKDNSLSYMTIHCYPVYVDNNYKSIGIGVASAHFTSSNIYTSSYNLITNDNKVTLSFDLENSFSALFWKMLRYDIPYVAGNQMKCTISP